MKKLILIALIVSMCISVVGIDVLAQLYECQSYTPVVLPCPPGTIGLGTYKQMPGPAGMIVLIENCEGLGKKEPTIEAKVWKFFSVFLRKLKVLFERIINM